MTKPLITDAIARADLTIADSTFPGAAGFVSITRWLNYGHDPRRRRRDAEPRDEPRSQLRVHCRIGESRGQEGRSRPVFDQTASGIHSRQSLHAKTDSAAHSSVDVTTATRRFLVVFRWTSLIAAPMSMARCTEDRVAHVATDRTLPRERSTLRSEQQLSAPWSFLNHRLVVRIAVEIAGACEAARAVVRSTSPWPLLLNTGLAPFGVSYDSATGLLTPAIFGLGPATLGDVPGLPADVATPGGVNGSNVCAEGGLVVYGSTTYATTLVPDKDTSFDCVGSFFPLVRLETQYDSGMPVWPAFKLASSSVGNAVGITSPFVTGGKLYFILHRKRLMADDGLYRFTESELWSADGNQAVFLERTAFDAGASGSIAIHAGMNGLLAGIVDGDLPGSYVIVSTSVTGSWTITHELKAPEARVVDVTVAGDGTVYVTTDKVGGERRLWRVAAYGSLEGGAALGSGGYANNTRANSMHTIALE